MMVEILFEKLFLNNNDENASKDHLPKYSNH